MTLESAIVLLILVIDPFGNLPLFAAALKDIAPARRTWVTVRELLIAYGVMVVFLFLGEPLLRILGISGPALTIAGGVILFLIAIRMVFPAANRTFKEDIHGEPFIVPLAIPYTTGPSVLAVEMLLMSENPERWPWWLLAITVAWGVTAIVTLFAARLCGFLGTRGIVAIERLMGMVLVAIAIEMFLTGASLYLRSG
ncbi:MAG: MarC family protein [Woeseiaceae bacterium]|nr:MarC family protein [Woeseiaceae bacterium]